MTTPPPYGSTPGQPQGTPGGSSPAGWNPNPSSPADQQGYGQPQYGQQPGYPQQPGYAPPASGYAPPPGYPSAPGYPPAGYPGGVPGQPGGGRPGMVTAAAVLAFVWGAFAIIAGIVIVAASSVIAAASSTCASLSSDDPDYAAACRAVSSYSGFYKVLTAGLIIIAILLIWGGVVALTGKNAQILVIGAGLYLLLDIVSLIVASSGNRSSSGFLGVVAPVLILVFMLNGRSKAWFKSKGARTF